MTITLERKSSREVGADDPDWARIVARDRTADGRLWYSVSTTGVYCRPSCPSRIANPQQRPAARHARSRQGDRLPAMQALQSGRPLAR